jgi:hypothetical protein
MSDSQPQPKSVSRTTEPRVRVQRHSPHRLLRKKLVLPGGITVSAEKHKGRIMVRVESQCG